MQFRRNKMKVGDYVFVSQKYSEKIRVVIGRIIVLTDSVARISGSYIIPLGLMEKVSSGRGEGRPKEVL